MPLKMLREFIRLESSGGIVLMAAALTGLFAVNSPLAGQHEKLLSSYMTVELAGYGVDKPLLLWINDGLMALFFLLVGLEIKREILEGQLASREQASLPVIAALGGLAVPALIYFSINWSNPVDVRGWAIPAATDIAFALGVISLLGKRVPESLKVCLVALAIIDDLAAIVIICLFYTGGIVLGYLATAAAATLMLLMLNRFEVTAVGAYIAVGVLLWLFVLKSGVHATLAGVVTALAIPLRVEKGGSPLKELEHSLHPWVVFGILPLFAFANSGVPLGGMSPDFLLEPVTAGITIGLFAGKQLGVMAATWAAVALGLCSLPEGVRWRQYYGMALLTGIGFTMSLFIGNLAFDTANHANSVRVGVIFGSLLSGLLGYLVLRLDFRSREAGR
jgi:NhaA family Na+:H+ antiporter